MPVEESGQARERSVIIELQGGATLNADLSMPPGSAGGLVIFAHGSGSSRLSPRNRAVAKTLVDRGFATMLLDLLTADEDEVDQHTREYRFDIPLLAGRLVTATGWARARPELAELPMGYFGASTGAAAALIAAADPESQIDAVVSRGGRPDMAADRLPHVRAPTLLIVGGRDHEVLRLNEQASARMRAPAKIEVVEGATHLFEERGALERVAELAGEWFQAHLRR